MSEPSVPTEQDQPGNRPRSPGLLAGRYGVFVCLGVVLLAALLFGTPPAVLLSRDVSLPPAYERKAQQPLADTSTLTVPDDPGERSHGAKLTPRLVGSILLYLARRASLHAYMPATILCIVFLLSGVLVGNRISDDPFIGLCLGLTFSGLYAATDCFSINYVPKPFDGIVLGLLAMTLIMTKRPALLAVFAFLSCWTDERALLSLGFIGLFVAIMPKWNRQQKVVRLAVIGVSIVLYGGSRLVVSWICQWQTPDLGMIGIPLRLAALCLPLAAWSCFEGAWLLIILAVWELWRNRECTLAVMLGAAVTLAVGACVLVLDVSRVSSFAFPLIPVAWVLLKRTGFNQRELRLLTAAAAAVSLLAPNFEIMAGVALTYLPPFPLRFFLAG